VTETKTAATDPTFNFKSGETLDLGSYVVAFFNEGTASAPDFVATANSGAILDTRAVVPPPAPEPGSLLILCGAVVGLGFVRRRIGRG
jgi:hypothetical protein